MEAKLFSTGDLKIRGELNTRITSIQNSVIRHFPFDGNSLEKGLPSIRYIRTWANGSTSNGTNHWYELKAFDKITGNNVALNKSVSSDVSITNAEAFTDGNISGTYTEIGSGLHYLEVDLLESYTLSYIQIWNYYNDGRTYYKTKTEVSNDGITWYTVHDYLIDGEYKATVNGRIIPCHGNINSSSAKWVNLRNTIANSDGSLTKNINTNLWDSFGRTEQEWTDSNVFIEWEMDYVDSTHGAEMVGLSHDYGTSNNNYTVIDYAIYTHYEGNIIIYENGVNKGTVGTWVPDRNDKFRVEVNGNTVKYYQNTNLIYTSLTQPTFPLFGMASLHSHAQHNKVQKARIGVSCGDFLTIGYPTITDGYKLDTPAVNGDVSSILRLPFGKDEIANEGTIILKSIPDSVVVSNSSYFDMVDVVLGNNSNRFIILRKEVNADRPNNMFIRSGNTWNNVPINVLPGEEHTFIWSWKVGEGYTLYVDGNIVLTDTSFTATNLSFDNILCSKHQTVNSLSIVKRRITDKEAKSVNNHTFTLTSNGDLITNSFESSQNITNEMKAYKGKLKIKGNMFTKQNI